MKKILVVDDSQSWVSYHKNFLEEIYGDEYIIETALSAKEGYDLVYNNMATPYCLIVSDLQMECTYEPKHAGEWFIEQVKMLKVYANTAIIIISAAYNIRTIASSLNVSCLPKATAARDLNAYRLAMDELLKK